MLTYAESQDRLMAVELKTDEALKVAMTTKKDAVLDIVIGLVGQVDIEMIQKVKSSTRRKKLFDKEVELLAETILDHLRLLYIKDYTVHNSQCALQVKIKTWQIYQIATNASIKFMRLKCDAQEP